VVLLGIKISSKITVKHGFKGLIAFIKRLLNKNIHFNIYFTPATTNITL